MTVFVCLISCNLFDKTYFLWELELLGAAVDEQDGLFLREGVYVYLQPGVFVTEAVFQLAHGMERQAKIRTRAKAIAAVLIVLQRKFLMSLSPRGFAEFSEKIKRFTYKR